MRIWELILSSSRISFTLSYLSILVHGRNCLIEEPFLLILNRILGLPEEKATTSKKGFFMKGLIIGCMLASSLANAQSLQIKVVNFNFTYQNPYGEGTATSFSRTLLSEAVEVQVEKLDKDFILTATGAENQEFILKDAPSFMTDADTMNIKGFNLDLSNSLSLSLVSGNFLSPEDHLKLDGLNLSCNRDLAQAEEMDQLINGCMKKMSLKSSKFSSESVKSGLSNILMDAFISANGDKGDLGIKSLELKTSNGKYDLEAEIKAQISGKVKSDGKMSYDPIKGIVTLKISEVKFGFFNITGKVFDELEKNESTKLQVKEPYVYYQIK